MCKCALTQQLLTFTRRPYTSWQLVNQQAQTIEKQLTTVLAKHGYQLDDLKHTDRGILAAYQPSELEFISKAVKDLRVMREVKAVVQTQYDSILTTAFSSFPTRSLLSHVVAAFLDSLYFSHIKWSPVRRFEAYWSGHASRLST